MIHILCYTQPHLVFPIHQGRVTTTEGCWTLQSPRLSMLTGR